MGKHGPSYLPAPRDLYPTPLWVTGLLADYLDLTGASV
jgi:hypothetical protein